MNNIDKESLLANALSRTSVIIPKVGEVEVNVDQAGQIFDTSGKNITNQVYPKKEKPLIETHPRKDVGELASNGAVNSIRTINMGLFRAMNTLKSFQELKQVLLDDVDTDPDVIQNLENIEQYLNQIQENYFTKKESLRNQF